MAEPVRTFVPMEGEQGKWCADPPSGCGRYLTMSSFHANRKRTDGKKTRCKDCMRAERLANPQHRKRENKKVGDRRARVSLVCEAEGRSVDILAHYRRTGEMPPDRDVADLSDFTPKEEE